MKKILLNKEEFNNFIDKLEEYPIPLDNDKNYEPEKFPCVICYGIFCDKLYYSFVYKDDFQ